MLGRLFTCLLLCPTASAPTEPRRSVAARGQLEVLPVDAHDCRLPRLRRVVQHRRDRQRTHRPQHVSRSPTLNSTLARE